MNFEEAKKILGLTGTPTIKDIRQAFRKMALRYHPDLYIRKAILLAVITLALVFIPPFEKIIHNTQPIIGISFAVADPIDRLSSAEKTRLNEIILGVMQDPNYLTPNIHAEFWVILDKIGPLTPAEIEKTRDMITGMFTTYNRYFYEDALWALKIGRPFKSSQREKYEKHLFNLGLMTEWGIKENDRMMEKIAYKQPISTQGSTVLIKENMIKDILASLEATGKRLDELFTQKKMYKR
jgi:hypothetical protein